LLFALGSLLYVNRDHIPLHGGIVVMFVYLATLFFGTDRFVIAFAGLLVYGLIWLAYVPRLPWFQGMSDYSYGVYIYGWPAAQVVKMLIPTCTPLLNAALALPAALVLGALSWHLVEKPALSLKRFVPRITLAGTLTRMVVALHLADEAPIYRWICQLDSRRGKEAAAPGQRDSKVAAFPAPENVDKAPLERREAA
jgi:hypothetical protein